MQLLRFAFIGISSIVLIGCVPNTEVSRDTAISNASPAIDKVVAAQSPNVPSRIVTSCIVDNASVKELIDINAYASAGNQVKAEGIIIDIFQRPKTSECVSARGLLFLVEGEG